MPPPPQPQSSLESVALRFTRWMGSIPSIIVHTCVFIISFSLYFLGIDLDRILLFLTTAVSLEAIYLSLFIQMTVNKQAESIEDVAEDIDEIQEDIDEIQEDVDEIQEDVVGISVDIDEFSEEQLAEQQEEQAKKNSVNLDTIYADLKRLIDDVEKFKQQHPKP
jgi:low affinity Fe/Cu permease